MKLIAHIIIIVTLGGIHGCGQGNPSHVTEDPQPNVAKDKAKHEKITEAKARLLATEHVNTTYKGHVWKTALGDRKFYPVDPEGWHSIQAENGRLRLKYGFGNRGQDFIVSMEPDGTDIRVEHHNYALR